MNVKRYYVYILQCSDNSLYTGYTTDMNRRLLVHEQGKGAKYTRGRGPFQLVYQEVFAEKTEALRREIEIKKLPRTKKEQLIQTQNDRRCRS
ncbi:GIY-YIG nuclease family protein [Salisediminibacterium halotolerans]|uniref:Endonuclease n=1 Tax=Salisediminibacterium halotolerans TaxID=517425 RepID=A0A1H9VR58_9BACI|nr:GIY-YIG nuclease family protein [Salisediminibacterium haloalkalitolerans]SES24092.1 putative endonuclease [Salisediminibacterium haloalkalitolerans]